MSSNNYLYLKKLHSHYEAARLSNEEWRAAFWQQVAKNLDNEEQLIAELVNLGYHHPVSSTLSSPKEAGCS